MAIISTFGKTYMGMAVRNIDSGAPSPSGGAAAPSDGAAPQAAPKQPWRTLPLKTKMSREWAAGFLPQVAGRHLGLDLIRHYAGRWYAPTGLIGPTHQSFWW